MFQLENNVVEVGEVFKEIMENPEKMFEMFQFDMRTLCEKALVGLLKLEMSQFLGREKYQRIEHSNNKKNYRNGSYQRQYTVKNIGTLNIQVPRDRNGEFTSKLLRKYERYDKSLEKDIALMFLSGLSTRSISLISKTLIGRSISPAEVSKVNKELLTGIEAWRMRPLGGLTIKYMYIDGVNFAMRIDKSVEKVPVLVVIGVTDTNHKVFLTLQQGDKESASTWREIFKDMKSRGLRKETIQLGIMDGLTGLEKVFKEEFPNAKVQRCQVHVSRNVLSKVTHSKKLEVMDKLRDIFYASSKSKAKEHFEKFVEAYEEVFPSAVKSLKDSIESCLTFYAFPKEEWISLRTTNVIERVHKEFKRRTKPMEILAGEESTYRILCFIALKLELNWRKAPLGKNNLPILDKFTQNS